MIPKKREDYQNVEGSGRPFEMNPRYFEGYNDAMRQKPVIVHLGELNGQTYDKGAPKNYHKKAGRVLATFTKYLTPEQQQAAIEDEFDIE